MNLILELDFQAHEFLSHKILRVTVEDSGIGIPDDVRKMLFQPFTQAQKMTGGTAVYYLFSISSRYEATTVFLWRLVGKWLPLFDPYPDSDPDPVTFDQGQG